MNILIVNYEFPPLGGGAANATAHIAKEMLREGHSIIVLSSHFEGLPYKEQLEKNKLTIIRLPVLRKKIEASSIKELLLFTLKSLYYAPKLAKHFDIDYSIAFFTIPSGISTLLLKYLYNIPYVVSLRGADVPGFVERNISFYHTLLKPLTKLIWKKAIKTVANSKGLKELALTTLKNNDTFAVITNGIDCNFFTPTMNNIKKTKIHLLYIGRFSKQKGLSQFIPLIHSLKNNKLDFSLTLVGGGPSKVDFENKIKGEGIGHFVEFIDWLPKEKLKEEYKKADIFVFPSLCEGMPNVVLEAMASGLAILASDIIGNNELVIDGVNGFIFPLNDTNYLTEKILYLAKDYKTLATMKEKSREIALNNYSWTKSSTAYLDLLKK